MWQLTNPANWGALVQTERVSPSLVAHCCVSCIPALHFPEIACHSNSVGGTVLSFHIHFLLLAFEFLRCIFSQLAKAITAYAKYPGLPLLLTPNKLKTHHVPRKDLPTQSVWRSFHELAIAELQAVDVNKYLHKSVLGQIELHAKPQKWRRRPSVGKRLGVFIEFCRVLQSKRW